MHLNNLGAFRLCNILVQGQFYAWEGVHISKQSEHLKQLSRKIRILIKSYYPCWYYINFNNLQRYTVKYYYKPSKLDRIKVDNKNTGYNFDTIPSK